MTGSRQLFPQLKGTIEETETALPTTCPWNKVKIVGQKAQLKLKDIWAIRIWLQLGNCISQLALFDLGLDSKLSAYDLVHLRARDICHGDHVFPRRIVVQQKSPGLFNLK